MIETWKPVPTWESLYEVSDLGRVRVLDRTVNSRWGSRRVVPGRVLRPEVTHQNRERVTLHDGDRNERFSVHRLVLAAFVGPCPDGMEACHDDDNPRNNRLSNLRWDTKSANHRDKVRNGRNPNSNKTHCPQGHPYSPENTMYSKRGGRKCRTCQRAYVRRAAAKRRAREVAEGSDAA